MSGKTGAINQEGEGYYNWLVGYVERDGGVYFFVTNICKEYGAEKDYGEAKRVTLGMLKNKGLLD